VYKSCSHGEEPSKGRRGQTDTRLSMREGGISLITRVIKLRKRRGKSTWAVMKQGGQTARAPRVDKFGTPATRFARGINRRYLGIILNRRRKLSSTCTVRFQDYVRGRVGERHIDSARRRVIDGFLTTNCTRRESGEVSTLRDRIKADKGGKKPPKYWGRLSARILSKGPAGEARVH